VVHVKTSLTRSLKVSARSLVCVATSRPVGGIPMAGSNSPGIAAVPSAWSRPITCATTCDIRRLWRTQRREPRHVKTAVRALGPFRRRRGGVYEATTYLSLSLSSTAAESLTTSTFPSPRRPPLPNHSPHKPVRVVAQTPWPAKAFISWIIEFHSFSPSCLSSRTSPHLIEVS
jgi:hypothetical protein